MATNPFFKELLKNQDPLLNLIVRFNHATIDYINWSHVGDARIINLCNDLKRESLRVNYNLSKYLLGYLKIDNKPFYDFKQQHLRLALMEPKILEKLIVYAGSGLYSEQIKKIVVKKELESLKEGIGDDVYFFAVKRASLIKALMPNIGLETASHLTKDHIFRLGKECLQYCFAKENPLMTKKLSLKFHSSLFWNFGQEVSPEQKTKSWSYLHRILIKEIEPGLEKCFI